MQTQQYGGGCVNEVCMHLMVKGVPFGGTGHSGMGAYHGEWGFHEFTHPSTVLYGSTHFNLSLREHPYTGKGAWKEKLLRLLEVLFCHEVAVGHHHVQVWGECYVGHFISI